MAIPHRHQVLQGAGAALAASLFIAPHTLRADIVPTNGTEVDWPGYNNDYASQRFSPLHQITAKNVGSLKEVCRIKVKDGGSFHAGPIVINGVMYVTAGRDTIAIDPRNCQEKWRNTYTSSYEDVWSVNRGAAYNNGRVFRGLPDGALIAIDAETGKTLWKDQVGIRELASSCPARRWHGTASSTRARPAATGACAVA